MDPYGPPSFTTVPGMPPGMSSGLSGTTFPGQQLPEEAEGKSKGRKKTPKIGKDGKPVTKKVVNRQFAVAGLFAILVAGVGVYLAEGAHPSNTFVIRAAAPIAAGTTVDPSMLQAAALPADAIEPGTIQASSAAAALAAAAKSLSGIVTEYPIAMDAQIHPDQFGIQANLGQPLAPTERLLSVSAAVSDSVSGALKPGDHVDILGVSGSGSMLLDSDVTIVAISPSEDQYQAIAGQQTGAGKNTVPQDLLPGDPVPGIYTLRLPDAKTTQLIDWATNAKLELIYRAANATDAGAPAPDCLAAAGTACTPTSSSSSPGAIPNSGSTSGQ
jgi:Flp pilus assembly protein CpaB